MGIGWDFPDYTQTKKKGVGEWGGVGGMKDFSTYPVLRGCFIVMSVDLT